MSGYLTTKPIRLPREKAAWPPEHAASILHGMDEEERKEVLRAADRCLRRTAFCEDILVRLGVDAVAMAEDNTERDSFAWLAAAKRRGIPATVISYAALSPDEAERAYCDDPAHQVGTRWISLFEERLPHWLRRGDRYVISRLPPVEALGRFVAGYDRERPWLINSSAEVMIALESARMKSAYLKEGFDVGQLVVAGHPSHDTLHRKLANRDAEREKLSAHGINPARPLILVAMPPDQTTVRPIEFGGYSSVQDAFTHLPRQCADADLLVSPHPNMTAEQKAFFVSRGIPMLEVSAAELLPLADLYIASVSTTIKWALACGVPVINYDVYGYEYPDYVALPQVHTAYTHVEFQQALLRWTDPLQRATWNGAAQAGRLCWGEIDGEATKRIVDLVFR